MEAHLGLSPLARGTLFAAPGVDLVGRFIPAGAGNTNMIRRNTIAEAVYPRWRGEHMNRPDDAEYRAGLSPLARGTQRPCAPGSGCVRFIPAGAGNTTERPLDTLAEPVYPRWRGEHAVLDFDLRGFSGLSPLARGTQ